MPMVRIRLRPLSGLGCTEGDTPLSSLRRAHHFPCGDLIRLEDLVDTGEIVIREFSDGHGHVGQIYFLGGVNE